MTLPRWQIFYDDGFIVSGYTEEDWKAAPVIGVQVVVLHEKPTVRKWTRVEDRQLWTGEDFYDPFGWGPKTGTWMTWEEYTAIWELAAYGNS